MGKNKKDTINSTENITPPAPKLVRRSANKHSTIKSGRTIGERREKLETASERATARNKAKRHQRRRIICTTLAFLAVIGLVVFIVYLAFNSANKEESIVSATPTSPSATVYAPTIEVIDEDAGDSGTQLTARMKEYIGQAEADFRELGFTPTKAVIPSGAIREVDFYLDGYTGFIKLIIDRGAGVSTEDASRVIRYLAEQSITDFEYIDVRIDGKAYWK
ncbi:hypothetical protein IJG04_01495 [Candidatus Saccharibacteria bacterium]|nr:hypothetical protein [Candidatus Saccharibacteria bacterium]